MWYLYLVFKYLLKWFIFQNPQPYLYFNDLRGTFNFPLLISFNVCLHQMPTFHKPVNLCTFNIWSQHLLVPLNHSERAVEKSPGRKWFSRGWLTSWVVIILLRPLCSYHLLTTYWFQGCVGKAVSISPLRAPWTCFAHTSCYGTLPAARPAARGPCLKSQDLASPFPAPPLIMVDPARDWEPDPRTTDPCNG